MARNVGAVIFDDSTRLYIIYDGTLDAALRPLFLTEKEAREWSDADRLVLKEPNEAGFFDEAVTIITDVELEREGGLGWAGSFPSRASKKSMRLTGPRSYMEMIYENGSTASRVF